MTLAAITMTALEAASPVQMYRATYSPDDNKLRLYAASRLDPETYKKVQSESEVQQICSALTQIFNLPFDLHNGHQTTMTLSIGYAMTIEHASAEKLQELADHNMYQAKHQRAEKLVR